MYIGHLCTRCKHPDLWRLSQKAHTQQGKCECGCRCKPAEPTVRPTWDQAGRRVERIVEPGGKVGNLQTCACADCKALFKREKSAA